MDAARGVALCGMLLAHYVLARETGEPGWLRAAESVADGRAAPLFCVLLGVGSGLYLRRRTSEQLARRGLVLFVIGLAIWPFVDRVFLILPHYGLLLAVVALCARLRDRWLLGLTAAAWLVPSVVVATGDAHGLRTATQPASYGELLDVGHLVWQLLWSGGYPVVGWVGFALAGLWVARRDLGDRRTQLLLVAGGVGLAATQLLAVPVRSALLTEAEAPGGLTALFDSTAHANQLAWYLASAGSALAVLGACLLLAEHVPLRGAVALGRCALSLYVLHLVIGAVLVWPWLDDEPLVIQLTSLVSIIVALTVAAIAWQRTVGQGPLEALLRRLAR